MKMQSRTLSAVFFAAACVAGRLASASPISYSYVTGASSPYSVGVGQPVTVTLYLREQLNGNSSLLDAGPSYVYNGGEDGLSTAGYKVAVVTGAATITASSPNYTDFSGAQSGVTKFTSVQATVEETSTSSAPVGVETTGINNTDAAPANAVAGSDYVYLGTVTITGGAAPGVTTFSFGELDASGSNTLTFPEGANLDGDGNSAANGITTPNVSWTGAGDQTTQFTVTTTPEPASIGLLGIAAAGLLLRRRSRIGNA